MGFYSYLWLREDGTPYYAGKGSGRRAFRNNHGVHRPTDRSRILIFIRKSEQEAFDTERELIRNWGRKDLGTGCLRNMTDGGEGTSGHHHSEAARKKIGAASIGNKYGNVNRGRPGHIPSQETRRKLAAAKLGRKRSPEFSEKQSARLRGIPRSPEVNKKMWDTRFLKTVAWG